MKSLPSMRISGLSIAGLMQAGAAVVCLATVAATFGRFHWFLELFTHFRVQYLLSLLIAALGLRLTRQRLPALLCLLFALPNLVAVGSLYIRPTPQPENHSTPLRAVLVNVNTQLGNPALVRDMLAATDPDLVVLEEINTAWLRVLEPTLNAFPHRCLELREDNFGIGLFSRLPLLKQQILIVGDAGVPTLVVQLATTPPLTVIATHPLPPGRATYARLRNQQLQRLPSLIDNAVPLLLLGDLNVSPWSPHFRQLIKASGLRDSARGFGVQATWPATSRLLRIPLDHCLHSASIAILDRHLGPHVGSDHLPLIVDFCLRSDAADVTSE